MAKKTRVINVFRDGPVWVAQKVGSSKASAVKNTKEEAFAAARKIALNQGLDIKVYDKYGKYQKTVRPQDNVDEGCFITTACVKYFGLSDDCYELETLRVFRDRFLLKKPKTRLLVKQYYSLAPKLVFQLENSEERKALYLEVFSKIQEACSHIEQKKYKKATDTYVQAISILTKRLN